MDFALFIALNAIMLIRPEELLPEITGARMYLWIIGLTTISALPKLIDAFNPENLQRRVISTCVLGVFAASILSFLVRGRIAEGFEFAGEFGKVILYYFLLVGIVDTPERLRAFLGWLVLFVCALATVALLQYFDVYQFPGLSEVISTDMDSEGEIVGYKRLISSGIFSDPNDLCLVLGLGVAFALYQSASTPDASAKFFWLLPLPLLLYAFTLTHSRGGMLGFLAGGGALLYARTSLRTTILTMIVAVPAVLVAVGGRQGDPVATGGGGTAHERVMLWAAGLNALFRAPLYMPFGLMPGSYVEECGLLAHNSFINHYVEIGILGGGFFLIAFYTAIRLTDDLGRKIAAPEWAITLRPYMLAAMVAYAAGCFSLSRGFTLPTYLVLGLVTVYFDMAAEPPEYHTITRAWGRRAVGWSILGLILLKLTTQFLGRIGV